MTRLHDLVIREISKYLYHDVRNNDFMVKLMSLNRRFYAIRHIFEEQLALNEDASLYAYLCKPLKQIKVHFIHLSQNRYIRDLSGLGACQIIYLFGCQNVTDISALSKCHNVQLKNCCNIRDVSVLANCRSLEIEGCPNIREVFVSTSCRNLTLEACVNIEKVLITGLKISVRIRFCHAIRDTSTLGNCRHLELYSCRGIKDISNLGTCYSLALHYLHFDPDGLKALNKCHTLTIDDCGHANDHHIRIRNTYNNTEKIKYGN